MGAGAAAVRTAIACAVALGVQLGPVVRAATPAFAPAALTTTTTTSVDAAATAKLRDAADDVRASASVDPLFRRSAYVANATRIATAALDGESPTGPGDNAPMVYHSGTANDLTYGLAVGDAIDAVVRASDAVLRYPMHTDGGWSVVSKRLLDGRIRFGVALVVGWPNPNVSRTSGCSAGGYCWSNGGLNPHLPWTRNRVTWYLSTANLPSAGESLVKSAIAKLNAVPRLGADLAYGGKTTATGPTPSRRFVVVFGSGCSGTGALGCTITTSQGSYKMVFQAKTIITLSRYRANPDRTWWVGTLMHEIAHGLGLGHYDSVYSGSYQLMRWANGPDYLKSGDRNGLRDVAPAGAVSAVLTPRAALTGGYSLVVRTANSGLGGVRAARTQCTDAYGVWRTVGLASGTWDTRPTERRVGSFTPPPGSTRYCRAIVRSKTASYTTPRVAVRG